MAIDYARWKPNQLAVARLLAEPDGNTWTNADLSREAGVEPDTISAWRRDDDFRAMVNELAERSMDDFLGETYDALKGAVRNGSIKAIELVLKRGGKLIDRKEIKGDISVENKDAGTLDDIQRQIAEIEKRLEGTD